MADEKEMTAQLVIYIGKRVLTGNTLGVALRPLDAAGNLIHDGKEHIFTMSKGMRHLAVGGVYRIQANDGLTTIVPEPTFVRVWSSAEDATAWQVRSRAAEAQYTLGKSEEKERRRDRFAELLDPIRREYRRASSIERCAIEAQLLAALRYGK